MTRPAIAAWAAAIALSLLDPRTVGSTERPILHAHSPILNVRDGGVLYEGIWLSDPASPIDVYEARRSARPRRVTFLSDLDSLSFDVVPGRTYEFIVVLDGRDSCATVLSTLTLPATRLDLGAAAGPDTIPIAIEHGKLHLRGRINGSQELDLIFDTGADIDVVYPSAARRGVKLRLDGTITNIGTGGTTDRRTSSGNRIEVAGLRWDGVPVLSIEKQADRADGILGYPSFSDRVLEFDYERGVMVVHDSLPPIGAGFVRVPLSYVGSLTAVEVEFGPGGARGPFILDTGGTATLSVNAAFAAAHGLPGELEVLGTSRSRGVGAGTVRNLKVLLPVVTIAGFTLKDVMAYIEQAGPGDASPPGGKLYMDVLERFDLILDYPAGAAYFRPNGRFDGPFRRRGGPPPFVLATLVATLAMLGFAVAKRRLRPRVTG